MEFYQAKSSNKFKKTGPNLMCLIDESTLCVETLNSYYILRWNVAKPCKPCAVEHIKMGQPSSPTHRENIRQNCINPRPPTPRKVSTCFNITDCSDFQVFAHIRTCLHMFAQLPTTGLKLARNEAIGRVVIATARCSTQSVTQRTSNDNAETQKAGTCRNFVRHVELYT